MGSELGLSPESGHTARLDGLGIFYIVLSTVWSILLFSGAAYLVAHRDSQVVRARGLLLPLGGVFFLHLYWVSVQLGYVLGPLYPGDAEYWIMGTYFPFGIALFHAGNSRFLYVAEGQRRFVEGKMMDGKEAKEGAVTAAPAAHPSANTGGVKGLLAKFKKLDHTRKVFVLVGTGMVFQILVTILMYVLSRKWHSSWGIKGTEARGDDEAERKINMGRGWEWWHTVFWQFFWAWVVAPLVLWKSRGIRDTQGWRLQTVGCCIASLHATPMWLIALYVPGMEKVNEYFIPPQWIAVSIMVLEIFTIFIPVNEVRRSANLCKVSLDSIAQWESRNHGRMTVQHVTLGDKNGDLTPPTSPRRTSFHSHSQESILTLGALEHVLERNPGPLLEFSALRDFSGENIAFLTSVGHWKANFPKILTGDLVRDRYNQALRIYAAYVGVHDAEFQVNLPSSILRRLEAAFEGPARVVFGAKETDPATPFAGLERTGSGGSGTTSTSSPSSDDSSEKTVVAGAGGADDAVLGGKIQFWGEIPTEFNAKVFDEAEANVKYLVLTNTWPKFVRERRSSMDSLETA